MNKFLKTLLISSVTFSLFSGLDEDLLAAAGAGDSVAVESAIALGADVNAMYDDGNTALIWAAAEHGHTDIVKLLLDRGADIGAVNVNLNTALICAAANGHTDTVRLLLDRGADINAADIGGYTALMFAALNGHLNGHIDIIRLLLDRGANIHAVNNYGKTALIVAAENGHTDTVRLLLDRGTNIDHVSQIGHTALILARLQGHTEIVKILEETPKIKQFVDNAIQGDSFSYKELIKKIEDSKIDSYEFNLILNYLINKIKSDGINKFSRKLLLGLAQHITAALNALGFGVIELPTEMLELILRRDILPYADFNYQFEMSRNEFNRPITEDLLGIVKALRFKKNSTNLESDCKRLKTNGEKSE